MGGDKHKQDKSLSALAFADLIVLALLALVTIFVISMLDDQRIRINVLEARINQLEKDSVRTSLSHETRQRKLEDSFLHTLTIIQMQSRAKSYNRTAIYPRSTTVPYSVGGRDVQTDMGKSPPTARRTKSTGKRRPAGPG